MAKRNRTKMNGLVYHAQPRIPLYRMGEREILMRKFNDNSITEPELRKLVNFLLVEKNTSPTVTVEVWGRKLTLTVEEYNEHFK